MSEDHALVDRRCAGCGTSALPDARFCGACGQELEALREEVRRQAQRAVRASARRAKSRPDEVWEAFVPVLRLWLILLLVLVSGAWFLPWFDVIEPEADVIATSALVLVVLAYTWSDRKRVLPILRHSGLSRDTWYLPLLAFLGLACFMVAYVTVLEWVVAVPSLPYLAPFLEHGWPLWSAWLLVSVIPGVFEELAFRGVVQQRLTALVGSREAVLAQAAMFSILHLSPLIFLSHFVMGCTLGWLVHRTHSLYPGMVLHMGWNAAVLILEWSRL